MYNFIELARNKHLDRYDYSKVEYKNAVEEEKIIKLQVVNTLTNFKNQVLA